MISLTTPAEMVNRAQEHQVISLRSLKKIKLKPRRKESLSYCKKKYNGTNQNFQESSRVQVKKKPVRCQIVPVSVYI